MPNTLPTLFWRDTLSYTLSEYFEDPDGDILIYSDSIEKPEWPPAVEIAGGVLYIIATDTTLVSVNRVWITATDPGGKSVSQRVQVVFIIYPPPDSVGSEQQPQLVLFDQALQRTDPADTGVRGWAIPAGSADFSGKLDRPWDPLRRRTRFHGTPG